MSFDGIKVDHSKLDTGSGEVIAAAKDIEGRLNILEDELKNLQEDWTGAAREAYREAKATWDKAITDMIVLLGQAGQNVDTSNQEYKAADTRGAGRF